MTNKSNVTTLDRIILDILRARNGLKAVELVVELAGIEFKLEDFYSAIESLKAEGLIEEWNRVDETQHPPRIKSFYRPA